MESSTFRVENVMMQIHSVLKTESLFTVSPSAQDFFERSSVGLLLLCREKLAR